MNIMQAILKRNKSRKFLLSVVALLLTVCMLPIDAYGAAVFREKYYGGGQSGSSYKGATITGATWPSNAAQTSSRYGYRFYIVDGQGNVQSSVKDLVFFDPASFNIKENIYESRSLNGKSVANTNERLQANSTTNINSEATETNGRLTLYSSVTNSGQVVNGNGFKQWMEYIGTDGIKNSTKVITHLYDDEYVKNCGSHVTEYLRNHPDWYLIIEPTMLVNVWTNVEYAKYKTDTQTQTYHYIIDIDYGSGITAEIDLCCSKDSANWNYKDLAGGNYYHDDKTINRKYYSNDVIKLMGTPAFNDSVLQTEYYTNVLNSTYSKSWNNTMTFYDYFSNKGIGVYSQKAIDTFLTKAKNVNGVSGYPYTKTISSQKVYGGQGNGIANSVEMFDYTTYCETAKLTNGSQACDDYLEKNNLRAYTFNMGYVYGTWYNQMVYLRDKVPNQENNKVANNGGMTGEYYSFLGNGFLLSESIPNLGLSYPSDVSASSNISSSSGNGIHVMEIGDAIECGDPIHTKNPVDPTPNDKEDPITPEKPSKIDTGTPFNNTGDCTIVKVYGDIYKDGSTVYHVGNKVTYSEKQTTDWIIVEDEAKYKLQQWVVSNGTPDTAYTASQWLNDSTGKYVGYAQGFDKANVKSSNQSGYKLTYTAEEDFRIGKGNTIYLLYIKEMPYIKTSKDPVPNPSTELDPNNPTYPENPYNPNNPDKQGKYNIVKVYAELDRYNGAVIAGKTETYTQTKTTPFIKIETESNWTLAQWKVTNTYTPSLTASNWCGTATTQTQLNEFYQNQFYNISGSTANKPKFGTTYSGLSGKSPGLYYFDTNGSNDTVYILFVRKKGDTDYSADNQHITESFITKRFSTAGYWDALGHYVYSPLTLKVNTNGVDIEEVFHEHLAPIIFKKDLSSTGNWTDDSITISAITSVEAKRGLISFCYIYTFSDDTLNRDIAGYHPIRKRTTKKPETLFLSDFEGRYVAGRYGDTVHLAHFKENNNRALIENHSELISSIIPYNGLNVATRANSKSPRELIQSSITKDSRILFNIHGIDLSVSTTTGGDIGSLEEVREVDLNVKIVADIFAGKNIRGTQDTADKKVTTSVSNKAISGYRTASGTMKFVPYIRMQYDTLNKGNSLAYVMSAYDTSLTVNEYAGIEFGMNTNQNSIVSNSPSGLGKIKLSSNQWSTHASATSKIGEGCALPGGATLNMSVLTANRNKVYVETMYPILAESGKKHVEITGNTGGIPDNINDTHKKAHENLVSSTIAGLETLNVKQWVSKEFSADDVSTDILDDRKTTKPVWEMEGAQETSYIGKDGKYYFRDDNDNDRDTDTIKSGDSNTGDLDIKQGSTKTKYYTFYVTTTGEIRCKDSDYVSASANITSESEGEIVLGQGETLDDLDDFYKKFNEKTGIVTNLLAALERHTGNDIYARWAYPMDTNGDGVEEYTWYNEAFDGITYAVTTTELEVGFINPYERTSLLDPELTPTNKGKGDLFTSYRYSQLKMNYYTLKYGPNGVNRGTIAYYIKPSDINKSEAEKESLKVDLLCDHLDKLMISDIFLIPNVTVQDLK